MLEGVVERIVFANEETAWTVARVTVSARRQPVTAVGNLLGVQPGESVRLQGSWVVDRRYGEQFRVQSYLTVTPATLTGIEKYLGSGLVRGIGKVSRIHRRKPPGRPMPRHTARANAAKSSVRARVEHPFAHQKGVMGLVIRTIGIARARATVTLANMVYNMKRWCWLDRRSLPA